MYKVNHPSSRSPSPHDRRNALNVAGRRGQDAAMTEDPAAVLDSLVRSHQLRGFVRAGRIDTMPARPSRRLKLLAEVAQIF